MHLKLSQSASWPGGSPADETRGRATATSKYGEAWDRPETGSLHPHPLVALLALLAISLGCSNVDQASEVSSDPNSSQAGRSDHKGPTDGQFSWPSPDHSLLMQIEVETHDSNGIIEIQLLPEFAPNIVEEVVRLAQDGHYDGTTFHRVIRGFMIQGGDPNSRDRDPTNDGRGGASIELPDELSEVPFERGVVALANRGRKGSNTSQFFILQADHRDLDGRYTAFGRVIRGIEFVDLIANSPTDKVGRWGPKDRPIESVSIQRVQISGPDHNAAQAESTANAGAPIQRLSQHRNPKTR